jgi:5-methylcytosine-specific restriction enzyme subunit McrC
MPEVHSVREHQTVDVPLGDLVDPSGRLRINPEVEAKGYFTVQLKKGQVRLSATGYVGLIPLNDRIVIDVRPRAPIGDLGRLLRISEHAPPALAVDRDYEWDPAWNESLLDLYAYWLVERIEEVTVSGLLRDYMRHEEVTSFPRGRIHTDATQTRLRTRGNHHQAVSSWFERTVDNDPNRCLKYAMWFIAGRLAKLKPRTAKRGRLLQRLSALYARFDGVPLELSLSFLSDPMVTGARQMPSVRSYYRPALDLSVAIIRRHAFGLKATSKDLRLPSIVLDMNKIFEAYLRTVLRRQLAAPRLDAQVLDGNKEGKKPLFDAPPSEDATPDIVCRDRESGSCSLIVEIKNIPAQGNPPRDSIEQAITYAAAYRCDRVVLAQPRGYRQEFSGLRLHGRIGDLAVYQYVFDLNPSHLALEEEAFAEAMLRLMAESS